MNHPPTFSACLSLTLRPVGVTADGLGGVLWTAGGCAPGVGGRQASTAGRAGVGSAGERADTPLKIFVAGAVAGVVSRTLTAPMDRLKVLLQVCGITRTSSPSWHPSHHLLFAATLQSPHAYAALRPLWHVQPNVWCGG